MNSYSKSSRTDALLQLIMLIGLVIGGYIVLAGLTAALGLTDMESMSINQSMWVNVVAACLVMAMPALALAIYHEKKWSSYLKMERLIKPSPALLTAGIVIVILPFLLQTLQWNNLLELPASMASLEAWMREMEEMAAELTKEFLQMEGISQLLFALFAVAVIPAITEEFMFRGAMQPLLQKLFGNPHVGIILAGAIFSAIHFQFYGFVPRMLLGVVFGYIFYWSGNLWYPILGHFLNNGLQVIAVYFGNAEIEAEPEMIGQTPGWPLIVAGSFTLGVFLLYQFYKWFRDNREDPELALSSKGPEQVMNELESSGKADWILVFVTPQNYLAQMARSVLEENNIRSVIIDKKDHAYQFGDVEVYCHPADKAAAEMLLQDLNNK